MVPLTRLFSQKSETGGLRPPMVLRNFQPFGQPSSDQVTLLKTIGSLFLVPKTHL